MLVTFVKNGKHSLVVIQLKRPSIIWLNFAATMRFYDKLDRFAKYLYVLIFYKNVQV